MTSQSFVVDHRRTRRRTVTNVIGALRCGLPNAGAILVTAHYDAIGLRSDPVQNSAFRARAANRAGSDDEIATDDEDCEWDWRLHPAPGANDNGTGIACLLEAARVLAISDLPFEFDILFVAFQGRSWGSSGPAAFADSIVDGNQEILARLQHGPGRLQLARATRWTSSPNETSEWFADYIEHRTGLHARPRGQQTGDLLRA